MASINVKTPHSGNVTYEGGKVVCRTPKQELFLLSASFLNEPKFYETAGEQASRIDELAEKVAADGEWILNLVKWLRGDGGLRTSAQVVAAACVHARLTVLTARLSPPRFDAPTRALPYSRSISTDTAETSRSPSSEAWRTHSTA